MANGQIIFMNCLILFVECIMDNQKTRNASQSRKQRIKIGKLDSLNIYEVTESKLEVLGKGSPNSVYLNFAVFLLSMTVSFLITLLAVEVDSIYLFSIFIIICVVGLVLGILLLVLWYRNRNDSTEVIKKIKKRLKIQ